MGTAATPHWHLILHGKRAGDEAVRQAVAALRETGVRLDVRVTWESGDARRYATQAIEDGVDAIVCGGGDGSFGEVAATLAQRDEDARALPAVGLLPLGTANDFASAAGIPSEPEAALRLLLAQPAVPIDLLRVETNGRTHWAANLVSGGFGAEVTSETHEGLKSLLGGLAYVIAGLSKLGRIEPLQARLRGPDFAWEGDFIALGIGNGRQAGGGQMLCPQARIDDGLLDVTVVRPLEGELLATLGAAMTEGRDAALERVAVRAVLPWVEIESPAPLTFNLDGEPLEATRCRIECVAGRLQVHLPADCPLRGNAAKVSA
jgi:lipid kinase YegS